MTSKEIKLDFFRANFKRQAGQWLNLNLNNMFDLNIFYLKFFMIFGISGLLRSKDLEYDQSTPPCSKNSFDDYFKCLTFSEDLLNLKILFSLCE